MSRRKAALGVAGLAMVMLLGLAGLIGVNYHAVHSQSASLGRPFTLTEADGKTVTDKDFRGKYTLIYFGYTSCPDVCPTTMADLGIALKKLGAGADEVQPLFITVDPGRDTPGVLKSYVTDFSPRLIGLTGSPDQIARVEREFHVYAKVHKPADGSGDYSVDHSSLFYLMGPDGRFISVLRADQEGDDLARAIAHYLT